MSRVGVILLKDVYLNPGLTKCCGKSRVVLVGKFQFPRKGDPTGYSGRIVSISHHQIGDKRFHHGEKIPPGLLSAEALGSMLDNREAVHRMTVYRKQSDGRWLLSRDVHTLSAVA